MHFSHLHIGSARRLLGALLSTLTLLGILSGAALAVTPSYCSTGTTTWQGGSGDWGTGNWSNGNPSASCDTVINGNVTVTFTTQNDHYGNEDTANTDGLTLSGGATVVIQGESDDVQGNWYNATNLNVGLDGLTIGQGSTLDLEASNATATPVQGSQTGGSANLTVDSGSSGPAPLNNSGSIVASTNDSAWGESLNDGGTLTNAGTITDQSGVLTLQGQNYAYVLNNTGTFNVASGAATKMIAGDGSVFANSGTVANQGAFTLQQSMHWNQTAGSVTGNPVQLTGGETLVDAAGTGSFEIDNCSTGGVMGAIPAGQTVIVTGGCSGTTLYDGGTGTTPLANHGTIDLNAAAGAGDAIVAGSELDNYGTVNATVGAALPLADQLLTTLVNEPGGSVNLSGGELAQTSGSTTTNGGTVNIGAGASWLVQGGAFANLGTLGLGIASPASFGTVNLTAGSKFTAGGTLAPALVSGYTPASGTEFKVVTENGGSTTGTFASVSGGFSADYSKQTASPGYIGLVYGSAASAVVRPAVKKLAGGAGKMVAKLSCAKGTKACGYTFTGTVGKTKVASGGGTVKAGKTVTVTLKLNKAGKTLLGKRHRLRIKLVFAAGGKTLKSATVTVTRAVKKK